MRIMRFLIPTTLATFFFAFAVTCVAQSQEPKAQDRNQLLAKIDSAREDTLRKEKVLLSPSPADFAAFADFLRQPNTGMARLMPREKYDHVLLTRGGGAYYSFALLTNEYGHGSDIGFEQGILNAGFAGLDFGFLTSLGDVPIDTVTTDHPAIKFLASFMPPAEVPKAREEQRRAGKGFEVDGFSYRNQLPAAVNTTYAMRSINYSASDLLVVFRVTRKDNDESLVLAWKILKTYGPTRPIE